MPNLNPDEVHFPMNIVFVLEQAIKTINPDTDDEEGLRVFKRPLLPTDDTESVGITAMTWTPRQDSVEIVGRRFEPTLQNYSIGIQSMVKGYDEARAFATSSVLGSRLRRLLYGSPVLEVGLRGLAVTYGTSGPTESVKRWNIPVQNFQNGAVDNSYILLSTLELVVETEIR